MRSAVLSFGVVAWAVGLAGAAPPPPPRVSSELTREFQAGVDAFRLGKYDEARAHLEKAEALDPKLPGPHRFLAAVAQAQRRYAECITEARRALQLNPQSREVAGTRKLHDECRAADGRPPFQAQLGENAAIAVTANVAGATVRIGALRYGGTPVAPRLIKAGFHDLEIEKAGWKPAHLAIDALPGVVTDIDVTLEPADAKPARH
ncbi:MAG TPA: tetratricopeptide repeat protein [Kofleriaceae bacterium]|nr:tetratricopeptide repeat protein [Kofleriaceae bacterium]